MGILCCKFKSSANCNQSKGSSTDSLIDKSANHGKKEIQKFKTELRTEEKPKKNQETPILNLDNENTGGETSVQQNDDESLTQNGKIQSNDEIFDDIKSLFQSGDKTSATEKFQTFLANFKGNPVDFCVKQYEQCPDNVHATKNGLQYLILQQLSKYKKNDVTEFNQLINIEPDIKQRVFECIKLATDIGVIKLSCTLFELPKSNQLFLENIKNLMHSCNYLQAGILINELNLMESFTLDEITIPLIFMNQFKLLENLIKKKEFRHETLKFLDTFLDEAVNIEQLSKNYLEQYEIADDPKFNRKFISKEMKNLVKLWKIDPEVTPNLEKHRKFEKITYYTAKYHEQSIDFTVFDENVKEVCNGDINVQLYLIKKLQKFSPGEAKIYIEFFKIPQESLSQILIDNVAVEPNNEEQNEPVLEALTDKELEEKSPFWEFVPSEDTIKEFKSLKNTYHSRKKSFYSEEFQKYLSACERKDDELLSNPIFTALQLFRWCPEYKNANKTSFEISILQELIKYKKRVGLEKFESFVDNKLLISAFQLIKYCTEFPVLRQGLNLFEFKKFANELVDEIKHLLANQEYKQAGYFIAELGVQKQIPFEDIVIPLIMLNDFPLVENLNSEKVYQVDTMKFLDSFISRRASSKNICRPLITKYKLGITESDLDHFDKKALSKIMKKYAKTFDTPESLVPNLTKFKKVDAMFFHIMNYYKDENTTFETFEDNVKGIAEDDLDLQLSLIKKVSNFSPSDAEKFMKDFELTEDQLKEGTNLRGPAIESQAQDNQRKENTFLTLKDLEVHEVNIVTDKNSFLDMINKLENEKILGLDTESRDQELCVIQIASRKEAFLIDLVESAGKINKEHWKIFNDKIFDNNCILKLGFALICDLKLIAAQVHLDFDAKSKNFKDLQIIWRDIDKGFKFPYSVSTPNKSLANLVQLCTGFKLNKKNQISNWKGRPLRADQIEYAALDAICLFQIYDIIKFAEFKRDVIIDIKNTGRNNRLSTRAPLSPISNININNNNGVVACK